MSGDPYQQLVTLVADMIVMLNGEWWIQSGNDDDRSEVDLSGDSDAIEG